MLFVLREALGKPVVIVEPAGAPRTVGLKKADLDSLDTTVHFSKSKSAQKSKSADTV